MPFPRASKALARFTVLDLTRVRAGPTCVRQLADWGANVIKIELPPGVDDQMGGPREGSDFQNLHRNKRSMTLNLKAPKGRAAFKRMVRKADVVVENFRPDVKNAPRHRLRRHWRRSTRGWSMPAFPALARTARMLIGPASIRSRRAWAD